MSSRVQKGSTIFKPLSKQRARSANTTPNPSLSRTSSSNVDQTLPLSTISSSSGPLSQPILNTSSSASASPNLSFNPHRAPPVISTSSTSASPSVKTSTSSATFVASSNSISNPRPSAPPTVTTPQVPSTIATPISIPAVIAIPSGPPSLPESARHPPVINQTPGQSSSHNDPPATSGSQILIESTNSDDIRVAPDSIESISALASRKKKTADTSRKETKRAKSTQKDQDDAQDSGEAGRPKRKRNKHSESNDDGDESEDSPSLKKRRGSTEKKGRGRRGRSSSTPAFDPHAERGEDIDPTVVTMAALCEDTGQGRISSKAAEIMNNHASWKASNRERRARMKAAMERKKYGLPEEEERPAETSDPTTTTETAPPASASTSASSEAPQMSQSESDPNGFDYSQNLTASRYNVQVRIGPNGETIIDEESLVVDRVEEEDTSNYTHVVESDTTKFVNSGTYGKRFRGSRWSAEETELFYDALAQYGENYELISYVLPGRDRKACKNKFKAEDKKNPGRINQCLNNSIPVDMATLSRMTGKDFSGPTPVITAPTPVPVPVPQSVTEAPESSSENQKRPPSPATQKTRKRSRSRTAAVEEGIQIIGDIDGFEP
ncbi:hypothetical protein K435DRAFT_833491 [Dendrothele bispora CBS 962.96]|uniref:Uncharacterized protein n=1 Tax=Dendrothele bispora (strain CBS 962.96) TaxID=1314807 RepID=A0A4V4HIS1_DENBC|nr:hypothetical protein K435DRAFT_833491 [Dendrothele bispora CBS 962.96]